MGEHWLIVTLTIIKAKLMLFLAAIAKTSDIVHPLWQALEAAGLIGVG